MSYSKRRKAWRARLTINGKVVELPQQPSAEAAVKALREAARKHGIALD